MGFSHNSIFLRSLPLLSVVPPHSEQGFMLVYTLFLSLPFRLLLLKIPKPFFVRIISPFSQLHLNIHILVLSFSLTPVCCFEG